MLGMAGGRHGPFDVVHNNSLHHLPVAMSSVLDVPVVTTLHTPPLALAGVRGRVRRATEHVRRRQPTRGPRLEPRRRARRPSTTGSTPRSGARARRRRARSGPGASSPRRRPTRPSTPPRRAGMPIDLAGPVHDPPTSRGRSRPGSGRRHLSRAPRPATAPRPVGAASVALVTPAGTSPSGWSPPRRWPAAPRWPRYDRGALPEVVDHESGGLVAARRRRRAGGRPRARRPRCDRRPYAAAPCERLSLRPDVDAYERVLPRARRAWSARA